MLFYGTKIIGYFSKEKKSNNLLSCLLILPGFRNKGFGTFLIGLAYELFHTSNNLNDSIPETPISEMGYKSFENFYCYLITKYINTYKNELTVESIADYTGINNATVQFIINKYGNNIYHISHHYLCVTIKQYLTSSNNSNNTYDINNNNSDSSQLNTPIHNYSNNSINNQAYYSENY